MGGLPDQQDLGPRCSSISAATALQQHSPFGSVDSSFLYVLLEVHYAFRWSRIYFAARNCLARLPSDYVRIRPIFFLALRLAMVSQLAVHTRSETQYYSVRACCAGHAPAPQESVDHVCPGSAAAPYSCAITRTGGIASRSNVAVMSFSWCCTTLPLGSVCVRCMMGVLLESHVMPVTTLRARSPPSMHGRIVNVCSAPAVPVDDMLDMGNKCGQSEVEKQLA